MFLDYGWNVQLGNRTGVLYLFFNFFLAKVKESALALSYCFAPLNVSDVFLGQREWRWNYGKNSNDTNSAELQQIWSCSFFIRTYWKSPAHRIRENFVVLDKLSHFLVNTVCICDEKVSINAVMGGVAPTRGMLVKLVLSKLWGWAEICAWAGRLVINPLCPWGLSCSHQREAA